MGKSKTQKFFTKFHNICVWGGVQMFQGTQEQHNTFRTEAIFFLGFGGCALLEEWHLPGPQLRSL